MVLGVFLIVLTVFIVKSVIQYFKIKDLQEKIDILGYRLDEVERRLSDLRNTAEEVPSDVEKTEQEPVPEEPRVVPPPPKEEVKEIPEPEFLTPEEEQTVPEKDTEEPFEPAVTPKKSIEFEFGSKWLQYIGIIVVAVAFILLTAYSIQYMTPLQENLLIYTTSVLLLASGEYIYRCKKLELYGRGLVFGGFLIAYIACSSSYYSYGLIDFSTYNALFLGFVALNIILGYRYHSSTIMLQGLTFMFLVIFIMRFHENIGASTYSLLLAAATATGCTMIYLFKHSEFTYYAIILSYLWAIFTIPFLDGLHIVTLIFITAIFLTSVFLLDKFEKLSMTSYLLDKDMGHRLYLVILILSYFTLIFSVIFSRGFYMGYLFKYDPWVFLGFIFIFQLIYRDQKETDRRFMVPLIFFLSMIVIGYLTYGIGYTLYIYLFFVGFILILGYKDIIAGERLAAYSMMVVVSLLIGGAMISLRGHSNHLRYYFESIMIFYTVVFCYLHLKHKVWIRPFGEERTYPISSVLVPLLLLYFTTSSDLMYAVYALPILLIMFSYRTDDVFTFNGSSVLLTYTIYRVYHRFYWRPEEVFLASSIILFVFAVIHEYIGRKENIPTGTSVLSVLMFLMSTGWIFGQDIETTVAWLVFGITAILCGLYMNRYHLRWIGLLVIIASIFKAFIVDIAELPILMKILSFALLGIMLLIISYVYTRKKDMFTDTFGLKKD
ncbi:MAG: DUF2339 domain-containing protein [Candidatus Saliniplasma sp.]